MDVHAFLSGEPGERLAVLATIENTMGSRSVNTETLIGDEITKIGVPRPARPGTSDRLITK